MSTIAFMHIGSDIQLATVMARSFRRQNPDFCIVQVSDQSSPEIESVDEVFRHQRTDDNLMLFRMRCFAALKKAGQVWFLDTDMLCHRPLVYHQGGTPQAAVCLREFSMGASFNHAFRGMDLSEHKGKTLGEIYPYIGCATMVDNSDFWVDCLRDMESLDPKFYGWYGDQEALRNVVNSGKFDVGRLPESIYACLPEFETPTTNPIISHYKGARKKLMLERAAREGLL